MYGIEGRMNGRRRRSSRSRSRSRSRSSNNASEIVQLSDGTFYSLGGVPGDGSCMFHAVILASGNSPNMIDATNLRRLAVDIVASNQLDMTNHASSVALRDERYDQYMVPRMGGGRGGGDTRVLDARRYVNSMRRRTTYAGSAEIAAVSTILQRAIEVHAQYAENVPPTHIATYGLRHRHPLKILLKNAGNYWEAHYDALIPL
jgi:hypothetical protein